jgi:hypothetical protein
MTLQDLELRFAAVSAEPAYYHDQQLGMVACQEALVAAQTPITKRGDSLPFISAPGQRSFLPASPPSARSFPLRPARVHGVGETHYVEPCSRMSAVEVVNDFRETSFAVNPRGVGRIDFPNRSTYSHRAHPRHPRAGCVRTSRRETRAETESDRDDSASHAMASLTAPSLP